MKTLYVSFSIIFLFLFTFPFACKMDNLTDQKISQSKKLQMEGHYDSAMLVLFELLQENPTHSNHQRISKEIDSLHEAEAQALFEKALNYLKAGKSEDGIEVLLLVVETFPETLAADKAKYLLP